MSDAGPTIEPEVKPSRSARLLSLIRKLIDYGKDLASSIRRSAFTDPESVSRSFGTADVAFILASIARGLHNAQALEAKVTEQAAWLDQEPGQRRPRSVARQPKAGPAEPADPRLASLPTPERIAAEVRRRPIGAVIADIFFDLGMAPSHPLWPEVRDAILRYGGNLARLLKNILDRSLGTIPGRSPPPAQADSPGPALRFQTPSGTDPP